MPVHRRWSASARLDHQFPLPLCHLWIHDWGLCHYWSVTGNLLPLHQWQATKVQDNINRTCQEQAVYHNCVSVGYLHLQVTDQHILYNVLIWLTSSFPHRGYGNGVFLTLAWLPQLDPALVPTSAPTTTSVVLFAPSYCLSSRYLSHVCLTQNSCPKPIFPFAGQVPVWLLPVCHSCHRNCRGQDGYLSKA